MLELKYRLYQAQEKGSTNNGGLNNSICNSSEKKGKDDSNKMDNLVQTNVHFDYLNNLEDEIRSRTCTIERRIKSA